MVRRNVAVYCVDREEYAVNILSDKRRLDGEQTSDKESGAASVASRIESPERSEGYHLLNCARQPRLEELK